MMPTLDLCLGTIRFHPVYAGPALRFQRYAAGLRARGVDMRVFCGQWDEDSEGIGGSAPDTHLPLDTVDEIPVQRVRLEPDSRRRMNVAFDRALARYVTRRGGKPDVVQLLNLEARALVHLIRMKAAGVPMVYTHTMMSAGSQGWLKDLAWSLPLQLMDCVVVSTGVMRDELRAQGIRSRIEIIPNGLDLERFRPLNPPERRELRARLGFGEDEEVVVFVGGFLSRRKGIDSLAEAWGPIARARPRARLVLVGPHIDQLSSQGGQREFLASVQALLAGSGAEDRVTFTGKVDRVEHYLQAADLFVFPSRREGMPNVVPEAFGCGVASVLTPFVGLPAEFGPPGETYVLAEREDLARPIVQLLEASDRRRALAERARTWVRAELDVENSLDRYAALYRELAGSR